MDEKVTMEALRAMAMNSTREFHVGDSAGIYSAQASAYRAQNLLGCKFTTVAKHELGVITITKSER